MPENSERIRSVTVYCGANAPSDPVYDAAAAAIGRYIAEHGMTLVFGGTGRGTMKTLADAALAAGGKVVGVISANLALRLAHPGLSELLVTRSLAERKRAMIERSDVLIALPGGVGTLDELFDALALFHIKKGGHQKPVGVLNVAGYYDGIIDFLDRAHQLGFASETVARSLVVGNTPDELFANLSASLPNVRLDPLTESEAARGPLTIDGLWRAMAKVRGRYGQPGGAPFTFAFYMKARQLPVDAWRKAPREIVVQMLRWVENMSPWISRALDCSALTVEDWQMIIHNNPVQLCHPACPTGELPPLDVLECINREPHCLGHLDVPKFVEQLSPEYAREFVWTRRDVDYARDIGAVKFADWLEANAEFAGGAKPKE